MSSVTDQFEIDIDNFVPGPRGPLPRGLGLDLPALGSGITANKVFATPFHLVFKKVETQEIAWIRVETLSGLKNVTTRVAAGELTPINAWSTLDRQLWGLLAEHVGFLRFSGPSGAFNAGLQPVGAEQAQLADDMTELFGGFEPAIQAISDMRAQALAEIEGIEPTSDVESFVKPDGVNVTPEGEDMLAEMVYGEGGKANLEFKKTAANAEILTEETEVESAVDYAITEIEADQRDLRTVTGPDAEIEARKVERAAEGNLEDEEEVNWAGDELH